MLAEHGVDFARRDYFSDSFSVEELGALLDEVGMKPSELLSKRSTAFRDLGLADREITEEELLVLMTEHPTLLRRPIVVSGGDAVVGFNKGKIEELVEIT